MPNAYGYGSEEGAEIRCTKVSVSPNLALSMLSSLASTQLINFGQYITKH